MLQPSLPLTYYTVEPHSAEGKIRNRLTSCKSFSGRASELVTDLLAIIDPSVTKSSRNIRTAAVNEKEDFEDQAGDGNGEDGFFDQGESSDHNIDDDGWESGSVHSQNDDPSAGQFTTPTNSDSEYQLNSSLEVDPRGHSSSKTKPQVKLKPEVVLEDDNDDYTLDSNPGSDTSNFPSYAQTKASKPSGGGISTFLPSLSVGYIPGTGDSDPEDELEAVEGKAERKNRRGQRARRA